MARAWIVDSRGIAKKVRSAGLPGPYQTHDCGANRQCPNCHHIIDNSDVCLDWPGLPAGVKFDPSDAELLEHLAAKRGVGGLSPHVLIDEFIPTLDGEDGICYTHPENLPGAKKDGSSVHFFYKIINAYTSGRRKRRRIEDRESMIKAHVRWHKTGKTRAVIENGVRKGFKKIMVLYGASKRGSKPDKRNWKMHQYHLGADEDEAEGEYVVSKIFYDDPQKKSEKNEVSSVVVEETDMATVQVLPKTPMTNTPDPPCQVKTPPSDCVSNDYFERSFVEVKECPEEPSHPSFDPRVQDEMKPATGLAGNAGAVDLSGSHSLLCNETIDSAQVDIHQRYGNASCGISDLYNLDLDTPPDFHLSDLQFPSQDSVFDWLDRL